jgi:hypothetical protein
MMTKTKAISMVAVAAVAILVVGIATNVSGAKMAYASEKEQTKVVVINRCANLNEENKHVDFDNIRCEINRDTITGSK